ncbi:MAG: hypothetical protein ACD_22C00024G0009 [uncultured bacterium]|nr:MAG: hypothetical protein ACD_22C00024G0009 [uncultured bacterium]
MKNDISPEKFVKLVVDKYQKAEGIFTNRLNAEDLAPANLSDLQKALYFFYVIQLDYAMKSQRLYEGAKKLCSDIPNFFTPQEILSLPDEKLAKIVSNYLKPRYINEAVRRYKLNSKTLIDKFQGNPIKIFTSSKTAGELMLKIKNFRGFGPKIGNFFVRTMINTFDFTYSDIEQVLPPVDVHDVRIAHLMGFIQSDEMIEKNINKTKKLWSEACKKANTSWLLFDKALWLLGSEGKPKSREDISQLVGI